MSSAEELIPRVYDELRVLARSLMRNQREGHTLQTTGLVHEACLRLLRLDRFEGGDKRSFFALAAQAMRHALVDHARRKRSLKRGGDPQRLPLEAIEQEMSAAFGYPDLELIDLDRALTRLAAEQPRAAHVVELLFFAGLTRPQAAEMLGVTRRTVDRDWRYARLSLIRELRSA